MNGILKKKRNMKSVTIRIFYFILCFLALFLWATEESFAAVPTIVGRVVTSTGAPIPGVWVRWRNGYNDRRHALTDSNGNFTYIPWFKGAVNRDALRVTQIDTNLDGTNDSIHSNNANALAAHPSWDEKDGFNCADNMHTFTAMVPVSMNGTFSSEVKALNNSTGTLVLDDIVFTPNSPASTPTPTPTGLTTKTVNFGIVPVSGISGNVFIDNNLNGIQDGGEAAYSGGAKITITGTSYATTVTNSSGNYTFTNIPNGPYTVYVTIPANYSSTSPTDVDVAIPPGAIASFGMVTGYTIRGNIFNDVNKNLRMDAGESVVPGARIDSTGGTIAGNNGAFDIQDLKAGTYVISYITPLPSGYLLLHPKPPSFLVTLGGVCSVDTTTGAQCVSDGIDNLNFAISDSWPWLQTYGLDQRFDNGVDNPLPAATACGGGAFASGTNSSFTTPGLVFSGDGSASFGQGVASVNDWMVGGISYPEVFSDNSPLKTSAQSLQASANKAGTTITPLSSYTSCQNPFAGCGLQGIPKGFYYTPGDILLNNSATLNNGNYVIVAGGSIRIANGINLTVPQGSTAIFAAGDDIIIDSNIRAVTNTCPVPAGQLQGLFSADRNIIIQGNDGDCSLPADGMLNIEGVLIANAKRAGGSLQNRRDLCAGNRSFPSLTVRARPDFVLNAPGFLLEQQIISHEETP
jgi:hypothetical protein